MKKRIALMVLLGVLVGGLVFGGAMLFRERLDYAGASNYAAEIISNEEVVLEFLEASIEELGENELGMIEEFESVSAKMAELYESFGASSALKDEDVAGKYGNFGGMIGKFEEIASVSRWLADFMGAIEAEGYSVAVSKFKDDAPNDFTVGMATEMGEFSGKIETFRAKYFGGAADDYNAMLEEYGLIMLEGQKLEGKYSDVSLVEAVGIQVDEVKYWFDEFRIFKEMLEEKK